MPTYTGDVYDIDFLGNSDYTQVLINGLKGGRAFLAKSGSQTILAAALLAARPATVEYEEGSNMITAVTVAAEPSESEGYVLELAFYAEDNTCRSKIMTDSGTVKVYTTDRRPQSILETALAHSLPVSYLMYTRDEPDSGKITRVKINIS